MISTRVRVTALAVGSLTVLGSSAVAVLPTAGASPSYPVVCASAQIDAPRNQVSSFNLQCADEDGNPVDQYVLVTQPAKAQLFELDPATGAVTYQPAAGADGTDTFQFKGVIDGLGESAPTDAVITLANERPVCSPVGAVSTIHDRPVNIAIACEDPDGDVLTITTGTTGASYGVVTTGVAVTYAPATGFVGADSFTLRATDGSLHSEEVTVDVNVTNARPTCTGRTLATPHDRTRAFAVSCADLDGDSLVRSVVAKPQHGSVKISGNQLIYTPAARYLGSDTFTITATDGIQPAAPARVNVSVTNAAPACTGLRRMSARGRTAALVRFSCTDRNRDAVRVVVTSRPKHGKLVRKGQRWYYVADRGYRGRDSFRLAGSDGVSRSTAVSYAVRVKRR